MLPTSGTGELGSRPWTWTTGAMGVARSVGMEGPSHIHLSAGAESDTTRSLRGARKKGEGLTAQRPIAKMRQPMRSTYHKRNGFVQSHHDARATQAEDGFRQARFAFIYRMDPVGSKQICRCSIATLVPGGPASTPAAKAFYRGWDESPPRRVSVAPHRRAPTLAPTTNDARAGEPLGSTRDSASLSPNRSHRAGSTETENDRIPSCFVNARLAETALAFTGTGHSNLSPDPTQRAARVLDSRTKAPCEMEAVTTRDQPPSGAVTRSRKRIVADDLRTCFSVGVVGDACTPSEKRMRTLIAQYAWSSKTLNTRASQWPAYIKFCAEEERAPLPMTESQTLSYNGWLATERNNGRRNVSASSLEQYISAIRTVHTRVTGHEMSSMPFLRDGIRAYQNWEEQHFPKLELRASLSAETLQAIWAHGMNENASIRDIRAAAAVVLSYCLGIRESSTITLIPEDWQVDDDKVIVMLRKIKGKSASRELHLAYHRVGEFRSPLDLFKRSINVRPKHALLFWSLW